MSALKVTINISGSLDEELRAVQAGLKERKAMHDRIAGDAEDFIRREAGPSIASNNKNHQSAMALGAPTTGHLHDAFQQIEFLATADACFLLVPGSSRLRAAFGEYTITPGEGKTYLTIPVARDSYGKRAGEFGDELFFALVGPKRQPVLARRQERVDSGSIQNRSPKGKRYDNSKPLEVLYILTRKSRIKEDRSLFPFEELERTALQSTSDYLNELLKEGVVNL